MCSGAKAVLSDLLVEPPASRAMHAVVTARVIAPSDVLHDVHAPAQGYARAAVFDADGTLWAGDIGDAAFVRSAKDGMLSDAMLAGPLSSWAKQAGLTLPSDKVAAIARIVDAHNSGELLALGRARGLDDDGYRRDLYEMQAWIYADQRRDDVVAYGAAIAADEIKAGIFGTMRALLDELERNGVAVYLASASHAALVEAGAVHLGVAAARVSGMEPEPGLHRAMRVRTYGDDKRDTAVRVLGARPLMAFGDSVLFTDRALLESACLPYAVATRGAHREAALAHARMVLVDP